MIDKSSSWPDSFGGLEDNYNKSKVVILPVPYEGTVTYRKGASRGPAGIIDASKQLEMYDEELCKSTYKVGISTLKPLLLQQKDKPEDVINKVKKICECLIKDNKFVVILGGEHSISLGYYLALKEKYPNLSVVQLDAHADLREEYEGTKYNHACVMARIRESCNKVAQIGVRSLSEEEALKIKKKNYSMYYAKDIVNRLEWHNDMLKKLNNDVFITIDADFFSWDVVADVGTPEPGGIGWYQSLDILKSIFKRKNVIGFDIVELTPSKENKESNSCFALAKLLYRLIGYKFFL